MAVACTSTRSYPAQHQRFVRPVVLPGRIQVQPLVVPHVHVPASLTQADHFFIVLKKRNENIEENNVSLLLAWHLP
jgi:hypothetical protein